MPMQLELDGSGEHEVSWDRCTLNKYFVNAFTNKAMQVEQASTAQLQSELEALRQELADVKRDKVDLEILLETITAHADIIEAQLQESNRKLHAEIVERLRAEAALEALLAMVSQHVSDLEILLETTTEHGDVVEALLYARAEETVRASEKRLAQFLDAMPVGVIVLNACGKPYYTNQRAQQLLGKGVMPWITLEQLTEVYQVYVSGTNQLYPVEKLALARALKGKVRRLTTWKSATEIR